MTNSERLYFAQQAKNILEASDSIKYFSITAYKPRVQVHIRKDPNKLYNYLIKLLLLDEMSEHAKVHFHPDLRNVKITSGDSLNDYLQTELFFSKQVSTELKTVPCDSASNKGVQFADMLSGLIQQHYESGKSDSFRILEKSMILKTLYFERENILTPQLDTVE